MGVVVSLVMSWVDVHLRWCLPARPALVVMWCELKSLGCCVEIFVIALPFVARVLIEQCLRQQGSPRGCEVELIEA